MSTSTSPASSPSHAISPKFHFDHEGQDTSVAGAITQPVIESQSTPVQTSAETDELTTAVSTEATLVDKLAVKEGIWATVPTTTLAIPKQEMPPIENSSNSWLSEPEPSAEGQAAQNIEKGDVSTAASALSIKTNDPEQTIASAEANEEDAASTGDGETSSRRFCGCLEGWLPSCIIDLIEWLCCCACCYADDEERASSPDRSPSPRPVHSADAGAVDQTDSLVREQIQFAIGDRTAHLSQKTAPTTKPIKMLALLETRTDESEKPFIARYDDLYTPSSNKTLKFPPLTQKGEKLRKFDFAFVTLQAKSEDTVSAQIHVYSYNEKNPGRPHHAQVQIEQLSESVIERVSADHPVLKKFKPRDFSLELQQPISPDPAGVDPKLWAKPRTASPQPEADAS